MAENFTQKFMNKVYKEHRENVLLEREKALMPSTQIYVELEIKIRKITLEKLHATDALLRSRYRRNQISLMSPAQISTSTDEFEMEEERLRRLSEATFVLYKNKATLDSLEEHLKLLNGYRYGTRMGQKVKRTFIRACPGLDCKGFLSSAWKCGICEKSTCSDCHELKEDEHTCVPSSVETARLIARDSRPCPNCASMIFKIDGCDQMWCTACHTAFSWRHGTIVTSIIHNPHYYDYMRANGGLPRNIHDQPCGGMPEWSSVRLFGINHSMYRAPVHAQHVIMNQFNNQTFDPNRNRELRIKFMLNELTEEKFKISIQRDEKNRQKSSDIHNVIEMFVTVSTDLFQRLVIERDVQRFCTEFENVRTYMNDSLNVVSKNYSNCKIPFLSQENIWNM